MASPTLHTDNIKGDRQLINKKACLSSCNASIILKKNNKSKFVAGFGPWAWFALPCPAPAGNVVRAPAAVTTPTIHEKLRTLDLSPKTLN